MENEKPTHDPSWCVWKAGRWDCLHAIDADHFWYGDVMVDLAHLHYLELQASRDYVNFTNMAIHAIGQSLNALAIYAGELAQGKVVDPIHVQWSLRNLNKHGLHTGVVFK